jgi:hypothetical protein
MSTNATVLERPHHLLGPALDGLGENPSKRVSAGAAGRTQVIARD